MTIEARKARYLLRFDDMCPTMDHVRWKRFEILLQRHRIRPILSVVPDNLDPVLNVAPADPGFWSKMKQLQDDGWAIAQHGFQHLRDAQGRSLVPLHEHSEFAGMAGATQRTRIESGFALLRSRGLSPTVWVAPRHGFDLTTIECLRAVGIAVVSDGFARFPYRQHGLFWIPQQMWSPAPKREGVWTICVHLNSATESRLAELESFISSCAASFTSVEELQCEYGRRSMSMEDRAFAFCWLRMVRWKARVLAIPSVRRMLR